MNYFMDTNICVYYLNGKYPNILKEIKSRDPQTLKIPSIVKAELLYEVEKSNNKKNNMERVTAFLSAFEIVGFDDLAAQVYSVLRANSEAKGRTVGPNDLIIASTVMAHRGILVTNDEKEFRNIEDLAITNWAK